MKKRATQRKFSYNGWATWETWLVNVWDLVDAMSEEVATWDVSDLGDCDESWCEDYVAEMIDPNDYDGLVGDLVSGFFTEVDWREIAEHVREGAEGYR